MGQVLTHGDVGRSVTLFHQSVTLNNASASGWCFARFYYSRSSGSASVCQQPSWRQGCGIVSVRNETNDPLALVGSVATLVIAAIKAGYLPARYASRIDPRIALRHD